MDGGDPLGYVFLGIGYLMMVAFGVWNQVFLQGRKGQTLGKKQTWHDKVVGSVVLAK